MRIDAPFVPDIDLIDRYLAGELSSADAERVHQWTTSRPDRDALVEVLCTHARGVALGRVVDLERWVQRLGDSYASVGQSPGKRFFSRGGVFVRETAAHRTFKGMRVVGTQPLRRWDWSAVVGVALGVTAIVGGWWGSAWHVGRHTAVAVSTYVTANGERATITLPDGNTAALNVASRLEVPVDYTTGDHTVRLTGEALFTVVHHDGAPFVVIAGPTTARVLGTSFVVRRYATDNTTTVAVRDGKVAVRAVVLTANQRAEISRTGATYVQVADPSQISFVTGVLTLDGLRLSEAIPQLDRWYDTDIRLGDPQLANRRLMGEVPAGALAELQEILEVTFSMRVVRKGRVMTLYPR